MRVKAIEDGSHQVFPCDRAGPSQCQESPRLVADRGRQWLQPFPDERFGNQACRLWYRANPESLPEIPCMSW